MIHVGHNFRSENLDESRKMTSPTVHLNLKDSVQLTTWEWTYGTIAKYYNGGEKTRYLPWCYGLWGGGGHDIRPTAWKLQISPLLSPWQPVDSL